MSSFPSFDFYAELGVARTSTSAEITAAYRRLALTHHPDKNANSPEATAKFQRIQASYETLNSPSARSVYDSQGSSRTSSDSTYSSFWEDHGYDSADEVEVGINFSFADFFNSFRTSYTTFERSQAQQREDLARRQAAASTAREAKEQEWAGIRKQEKDAKAKREAAEVKEKAEKEEAERKRSKEMQVKKEAEQKAQLAHQKRVWDSHNAVTTEQRRRFCQHVDFWDKVQSEIKGEKLRCGKCKQRRGVYSFQCHLCDLVICQVCLNDLTKKRKTPGFFGKSTVA